MNNSFEKFDVVVIGGGFYGLNIALLMKEYFSSVLLIEKEKDLMQRASLINQARVHNGYHYPRNIITAYRSYVNFPRFCEDFRECIIDDFDKLYVIAKNGSKVNAKQFTQMYSEIGTPIEKASPYFQRLFNKDLVEDVFLVTEYAFDSVILKEMMREKLYYAGVDIRYEKEVVSLCEGNNEGLILELNNEEMIESKYVFNCTYSQINKLLRNSDLPLIDFKHELTEMALIDMPDELKSVGITVMDGAFFSSMPYPSKNLHSLSHVRYTPHYSWIDKEVFIDGHSHLKTADINSNSLYMIKDAERYIPLLSEAKYKESIYEVKTVLLQNEDDDGRPILYRENYGIKNFFNIMGGKIDNIYDITGNLSEKFDSEVMKLHKNGVLI